MYQKTTNANDLACDECTKKIPTGTVYFDDSIYNSLYAKVEIQKSLCLDCGESYWKLREDEYQKYELSQRWPRIRRLLVSVVIIFAILFLLDKIKIS